MKRPQILNNPPRLCSALFTCSVVIALLFLASLSARGAENQQILFQSPAEAVEALVAAVQEENQQAMLDILGPGSKELISSGDIVADKAGREKFLAAYAVKNSLEAQSAETMILHIGHDAWSMPIPIVKKGNDWGFDSERGREEIINRRIGRNELHVIDVINAFVVAEHEYACQDCRGDGTVEFAQRFISTPGNRDGLYWEVKEGDATSPLGPLIANAAKEGYGTNENLSPFHGYYFKILKGQGENAKGGAYDYVVNGKMILGFALVAYPAEYGNSGVMTFMVNQEGIIFEKNLGEETVRIAEAMNTYNPDQSWEELKDDPL